MPIAAALRSGRTASAPTKPTTLPEDRATFGSQTNQAMRYPLSQPSKRNHGLMNAVATSCP